VFKLKKVLKILVAVVITVIVIFAGGLFYLYIGLETGSKVPLAGLNLSDINDGVYSGDYKSGRWSNKLNVTVKSNKITGIEILDDVTFSDPNVTEKLIGEVIDEQDTNIDIVSGATVTSKAYLKSIENALKSN
jgi:uncharacterized protein with FMN-binding domain